MLKPPAFLVELLSEHLAHAPESEFVFPVPQGGPSLPRLSPSVLQPAVRMAGLEPLTPHELRHTHAAMLIRDGANPLAIQKRLGHKDIRTTLNVYGHLFPEQDEILSELLDATYGEVHGVPNTSQNCERPHPAVEETL